MKFNFWRGYENRGRDTQAKEGCFKGAEDRRRKLCGDRGCGGLPSSVRSFGGNHYASYSAGYQAGYDPACRGTIFFLSAVGSVDFCMFSVYRRLGWVNYGVYIFLMVHVCYFFGWQNTISVNAVMGTHYLMTPDYSVNFAANELVLIMIGTSLALAMNWRMPSNLKVLREDIRKVEDDMQQVLLELAGYLGGNLQGEHIWIDLDRLEEWIHEGLERAHEHAHNTLSEEDRYYDRADI